MVRLISMKNSSAQGGNVVEALKISVPNRSESPSDNSTRLC